MMSLQLQFSSLFILLFMSLSLDVAVISVGELVDDKKLELLCYLSQQGALTYRYKNHVNSQEQRKWN